MAGSCRTGALVARLVMGAAAGVPLAMPVGVGFFCQRPRRHHDVAGFSDGVKLGGTGV